jgi:O-methyltransferase involved in polyketide biosynthesis
LKSKEEAKMEGNLLVHKTAILVLYMRSLYSAPDSIASLLAKKLDVEKLMRQFIAECAISQKISAEEIFSELRALAPVIESRTIAVDVLVNRPGFNQFFCLGAGLCPSGIAITNDAEKKFYHTDLSKDLLNIMADFANENLERKRKLHFLRLDVLNEGQMERIPWMLGYEPCSFFSTGLLQYLNMAQKEKFFELLSQILQRAPGSAYVTVDMSTKEQFSRLFSLRPSALAALELVSGMTGSDLRDNSFEDDQAIADALARVGLRFEVFAQESLLAGHQLRSLEIEGVDREVAQKMIATRKVFRITSE